MNILIALEVRMEDRVWLNIVICIRLEVSIELKLVHAIEVKEGDLLAWKLVGNYKVNSGLGILLSCSDTSE